MSVEWSNPYVTTATPGYFACWECMKDVLPGDLVQRDRNRRRGDGNKMCRHLNCADRRGQRYFDALIVEWEAIHA